MALKDRAVLVDWSAGMWGARVQDDEIAREVLHNKNAAEDAGVWIKRLAPEDWLKELRKIKGQANTTHNKYTVPFLRDGQRACPNVVHGKYRAEMSQHEEKWDAEVQKKLVEYKQILALAPARMAGTYNPNDFPSEASMVRKFHWRIVSLPMPDADNWVTYLVNGEAEQVKEELRKELGEISKNISRSLWQRLYVPVKAMVEALPEYTGKREGSFKDSLVGNIVEIVDLLPDLNIGEDVELAKMVGEVKKRLTRFSAQDLRDSEEVREVVLEKAQEILDRMGAYVRGGSILDD